MIKKKGTSYTLAILSEFVVCSPLVGWTATETTLLHKSGAEKEYDRSLLAAIKELVDAIDNDKQDKAHHQKVRRLFASVETEALKQQRDLQK